MLCSWLKIFLYKLDNAITMTHMATTKELIQASDDIVWDSNQKDAYTAARKLMLDAMQYCILPHKVYSTRKWAIAQSAVHDERAKAFEEKLKQIQYQEGVSILVNHHKVIAARYKAVANAMRD